MLLPVDAYNDLVLFSLNYGINFRKNIGLKVTAFYTDEGGLDSFPPAIKKVINSKWAAGGLYKESNRRL